MDPIWRAIHSMEAVLFCVSKMLAKALRRERLYCHAQRRQLNLMKTRLWYLLIA